MNYKRLPQAQPILINNKQNSQSFALRVLHVESLDRFHFALESDYSSIDSLMREMINCYDCSPSGRVLVCPDQLLRGELYAVQCYGEWYRGRLEQIDSNWADYQLLDFGEWVRLPADRRQLVASLPFGFRQLPAAARLGKLDSVGAVDGMESESTNQFLSLVKGRTLHGFCTGLHNSEQQPHSPLYSLRLFYSPKFFSSSFEKHRISKEISQQLLDLGLAKWL